MKNWKLFMVLAIIAIFGIIIGFMACDNSKNDPVLCKCENKEHLEAGQSCNCGGEDCNCSEEPKIKPDTTMPLAFNYNGTLCKVIIKSENKFTSNEWSTFCVKVVDAIMRGYNKDMGAQNINDANKSFFEFIFKDDIKVILSSTAIYSCEVKENDYSNLYLKTSTLDTVDLQPAIWALFDEEAYHP